MFNLIKLIMIFLHFQIQPPIAIFDKMLPIMIIETMKRNMHN